MPDPAQTRQILDDAFLELDALKRDLLTYRECYLEAVRLLHDLQTAVDRQTKTITRQSARIKNLMAGPC